ncbi:MAG: TolC family protein [Acidobacteriota bacterium]
MFSDNSGAKRALKQWKSIQVIIVWLFITGLLGNLTTVFAQQANKIANTTSSFDKTSSLAISANVTTLPRVSLTTLIEQTLENNPEIKSLQRNYDMMRARIPQAKAMPEPMLEVGYMGNIIPLPPLDIQKGDPSSARMISFTQEIPFPGERSLRGKMALMEADSNWWLYEQTRFNIIAELKQAYFEYWYLTKAIDTLAKNKELLEKFAKITESSYSVGRGTQQDLLKAQVEISRLIEQQALLTQRQETIVAQINSLRYQEINTLLGTPEELRPFEFDHTLAGLNEIALSESPSLKLQRRRIDREQYAIQLAKKEFYPDMSFGFSYQNRPGMPEMYGITFGLKLPLYFWQKQRPALTEAVASASMEKQRLDNTIAVLQYRIKDRYLALTTAQQLINLYRSVIIPQATAALESAIVGYETGKVDFLTLLNNQLTLLNYQLSYYEQLSNAEKAVASLEPLVGTTLRH